MEMKNLLFEEMDGLGILKFNRPEALNALNKETLEELTELVSEWEKSKTLRCVIATGNSPKAFIAGADIKEFVGLTTDEAEELATRGQEVFMKVANSRIPVIAAVNGFALGGGLEFALACDFIICSENAKFGLPEVGLGLMPGFGGTQRLRGAVGRRLACEMTYTGGQYDAAFAKENGLANRVVSSEALMDTCKEIASAIMKKAPLAVTKCKQAIFESKDLSRAKGMELEASLFGQLFATKDCEEGTKAFIEKRRPEFQGH